MIDDGIYNRIIETEAKNEIKEMNRNYSNVDKNLESYIRLRALSL